MKGGIPKFCPRCRTKPVAWTNPLRVDYCYDCLPGGPYTPPPCDRCQSTRDYYSAGLCLLCHPEAPQQPGSCKDCYAWGVVRKHKWLCWGCCSWRTKFEVGTCTCCRREITVDDDGVCRLCWRQAASLRWTKTGLSLAEASQYGQQLFLANLHQRGKRATPATPYLKLRPRPQAPPRVVTHHQLALLDLPRTQRSPSFCSAARVSAPGSMDGATPPPRRSVAEWRFSLHCRTPRAHRSSSA